MLLSGPGRRRRGHRRASPRSPRDESGRRHHARQRGGASTPTSCASEQIAGRDRRSSAQVRVAGGGGGGGGNWMGGMGGSLAPTPELLAQVDALPPATADPRIDVAVESRPAPDFRFLRFIQRYRGGLSLGLLLVALDAVVHARRAAARALRHRPRRRRARPPRRCSRPRSVFLAITLFDWWVMWAQRAGHGPHLGTAAARAADQGVRPSPAARRRLLRARDGRAAS